MEVRDYNGSGRWSRDGIIARYRQYCRQLGVDAATELAPREHRTENVHWIYPAMDEVIRGIEAGDRACIAIGLDFIEEDEHFPFGKVLKSNTARALRRAHLDGAQIQRVRKRVFDMLLAGKVPHEFEQYAKLVRHIGVGERWEDVEQRISRDNPYVVRWFNYFRQARKDEMSAV